MTTTLMVELRPISWVKGALRDFEDFPAEVRLEIEALWVIHAFQKKSKSGIAGMLIVRFMTCRSAHERSRLLRGDRRRIAPSRSRGLAVACSRSRYGIKTPQTDVDLIHARLKRLKEALR